MFQVFFLVSIFLATAEVGQLSNAPQLCLEIAAASPGELPKEGFAIDVRLVNCGAGYIVVPRRIIPARSGVVPEPWGVLTFELFVDGSTEPAKYFGAPTEDKTRLPTQSDYIILPPSHFYGAKILLSDGPFGYAIGKAGTYRIRAAYKTDAREWVEKKIQKGSLDFETARIFSGNIQSKEIVLSIR